MNETSIHQSENIPPTNREILNKEDKKALCEEVVALLAEQGAVLVAHYYTDAEIQILAEKVGGYVSDSLDMARFGFESEAETLVVAGVRFMGETAKILNPDKRVIMPTLKADCSLDLGCPPERFKSFCENNKDRTVVVYANTSAAVKANADWMVTSGSAVEVVTHLASRGEKILWAPDKYLGDYVREQSGADMLLWNGACVVHEEFKSNELEEMRIAKPNAVVLAHPESPRGVVTQADFVGSTSALIEFVGSTSAEELIVATDKGIFHKMSLVAPQKKLYLAPTAGESATCRSCGECPWMAMNSLTALRNSLLNSDSEIFVEEDIATKARLPIKRLLEFTASRGQVMYGNNDA
ncbi:MAG: quinolinate synthase NadA [Pseudomonadota bacterium]|nr:quinolinate synthase NadA [Pseudomonadota bacterium]